MADEDERFSNSTQSNFYVVRCTQSNPDDPAQGRRLFFSNGNITGLPQTPELHVAALFCFPRYNIYRTPVRIEQTGIAKILPSANGVRTRKIPGLDLWPLAAAFYASMESAESMIRADTPKIKGSEEFGFDLGFFFGFLDRVNPQANVADWTNLTLLNSTLQDVWSTWSAQIAATHLKQPSHGSVMGDAITVDTRVLVHTVPLWLIEAGLLSLIVVSLSLCVVGGESFVFRDPANLGGLAAILAASKDFQRACTGAGCRSADDLSRRLQGSRFSTATSHAGPNPQQYQSYIKCHSSGDVSPALNLPLEQNKEWWQPRATSRLYIAAILNLLLLLIGLLEGLYQFSRKHNGLIAVSNATGDLHFAWTAVPAFVMVTVGAIVGMQYFAIDSFFPYQRMMKGRVPAKAALFAHSHSVGRLLSFDVSFGRREFTMVLSTLAVLLASFLTIAVSGLFSPKSFPALQTITIEQSDWFDHSTQMVNKSPFQIELVTLANLSYPRFTYETLAFPTLVSHDNKLQGTVNINVPAVQGVMNCSLLPQEDILTVNNTWYGGKWSDVALVALRDRGCLSQFEIVSMWPVCKGGPYGGGSYGPGTPYNRFINGTTAPGGLCASQLNNSMMTTMYFDTLARDGEPNIDIPADGYFGYAWGRGHQATCPTTMILLGRTINHLVEEATVFTCNPFVHKVQVNATFLLPGMDIDKSAPPRIIDGISENFALTMPEPPSWGIPEGNPMDAFDQLHLPQLSKNEKIGPFIDIMVYGSNGIPMNELSGVKHADRLISAADQLWGVGMAQLINDYRRPVPTGPIKHQGMLSSTDHFRLVQSSISTRILEALLAAIAVCMVIVYFMADTQHVLKHNPYTIVGLASLIIDSELLARNIIPPGAERLPDNDLLGPKVLGGWLFSLGWWSSGDDEKPRRFGVDVGEAEFGGSL